MILTWLEHNHNQLHPASGEVLTLARTLATDLSTALEAVLIDSTDVATPPIAQCQAYGISKVHLIQHAQLTDYAPEAWAKSMNQLVDRLKPQAILAAGTDSGQEMMAHLAAQTDLPLATNCTAIEPGENYIITRLRWGGSLTEEARLSGSPKLLTVAPHNIVAAEAPVETVAVETMTPDLAEKDFRVRLTERLDTAGDKISLTDARVVVSGGRGVGSAEGFASLEELATLLGGAVGCSRAVTNNGWRPHADQVGQTGTRVAPDIYIACGISGAIQHIVGCKGAKQVLVINTDPEAPILTKADYAVIGDLHQVLPAISAEIKKLR